MAYKCHCGRNFGTEKHLRQHQQACQVIKDRDRDLYEVLSRAETSRSANKRRSEAESSSQSSRFMGLSKRRKKVTKNDGHSLSTPSHNDPSFGSSSYAQTSEIDISLRMSNTHSSDAVDVPTPAGTEEALIPELMAVEPEPDLPARRVIKLTERARAMLEDSMPEGPGVLQSDDEETRSTSSGEEPAPVHPPSLRICLRRIIRTAANKFGLVRTYHGRPSAMPPSRPTDFLPEDMQASLRLPEPQLTAKEPKTVGSIIHPYPNMSTFLLNRFHWNGSKKTKRGRKELIEDVLLHPDFNCDDLRNVDMNRLDEELAKNPGGVTDTNGWKVSSVPIYIPTGHKQTAATRREEAARRRDDQAAAATRSGLPEEQGLDDGDEYPTGRKYHVAGLHHRSLVDILVEGCSGPASKEFHWHPFEEHWTPPWDTEKKERVYSEIYSSDAFLEADRLLHASPPEPECDLPRCVVPIMLYSDATHVAQFGQAKLWPVYGYFGNDSKYIRGRPSRRTGFNVAFLPSLPNSVAEFILMDPAAKVTMPLLAHCKRELFHGCWRIILDDEFVEAYEHGIIVDCGDGVRRRLYPRIFFYSADYPEKVLVATIRDMGQSKSRATDVSTIKKEIHRWIEFTPPIDPIDARHLMGFKHPQIGRMLCPATLDWDDPSIRQQLYNGQMTLGPNDLPRLLWKDEKVSETKLHEGFMQGNLLLKAYLHIFIGPTSAKGTATSRSTRQGNAAIHNIRKVSIYSIAYAATILRFVLSGQSIFSQGGKSTAKHQWAYGEFYYRLVNMMKGMIEEDREDLLEWWQEVVFGGFNEDEDSDCAEEDSMAGLMRMQAEKRREQKQAEAEAAEQAAQSQAALAAASNATPTIAPVV